MRLLLGTFGMVVAYYAVPAGVHEQSTARLVGSVLLTLAGIAALGWAIVAQLRQRRQSLSEDVNSLLLLLGLVVMVFALGYFVLDAQSPRQISGDMTRTDSLYFTLSTLTTVGFGDIHALGQLARVIVILQLLFDVVFVTALVSTLTGSIRSRTPHFGEGRNP